MNLENSKHAYIYANKKQKEPHLVMKECQMTREVKLILLLVSRHKGSQDTVGRNGDRLCVWERFKQFGDSRDASDRGLGKVKRTRHLGSGLVRGSGLVLGGVGGPANKGDLNISKIRATKKVSKMVKSIEKTTEKGKTRPAEFAQSCPRCRNFEAFSACDHRKCY
jgi:hypothetical protein